MGIEVTGIGALLVLILDIWAILNVVGASTGMGSKLLWIVLILLLPIFGVVLWFFFGPRSKAA